MYNDIDFLFQLIEWYASNSTFKYGYDRVYCAQTVDWCIDQHSRVHVVVVGWQKAEMEVINSLSYRIKNDCHLTWSHEAYFFSLHEYRNEGYAGYSYSIDYANNGAIETIHLLKLSRCNPLRLLWDICF